MTNFGFLKGVSTKYCRFVSITKLSFFFSVLAVLGLAGLLLRGLYKLLLEDLDVTLSAKEAVIFSWSGVEDFVLAVFAVLRPVLRALLFLIITPLAAIVSVFGLACLLAIRRLRPEQNTGTLPETVAPRQNEPSPDQSTGILPETVSVVIQGQSEPRGNRDTGILPEDPCSVSIEILDQNEPHTG